MDITFDHGNNSWKFHDDTMMGTWWKRCDRRTDRQTDRRTDRQTENTICRAAWSQLKSVDYTSVRSSDIHLRAISQEISQSPITKISLESAHLNCIQISQRSMRIMIEIVIGYEIKPFRCFKWLAYFSLVNWYHIHLFCFQSFNCSTLSRQRISILTSVFHMTVWLYFWIATHSQWCRYNSPLFAVWAVYIILW